MDCEVQVHLGMNENSSSSVDHVTGETAVVMRIEENGCVSERDEGNSKPGADVLASSKVSVDKLKTNTNVSQVEKHDCVIDVKCNCGASGKENFDTEKICRICHLSVDRPSEGSDLIQLGCSCKDELGIAHRHCAEVWFKLKGNRCCEICGVAAKNIKGVGDNRFIEEWNERVDDGRVNSSGRRGLWRAQPFCNFLMACLVIAFILPWFFCVNMF